MSKYRNCKVKTAEGLEFDSRKEYYEYLRLFQLQNDGKIMNLKCQVKYELIPKQKLDRPYKSPSSSKLTRSLSAVNYTADFVYDEWNEQEQCYETVVVDTKGFRTKDFIIKKKLMKYIYNIEVVEK